MGVRAASGCYPKRAEIDETTAGVPALRAPHIGKSAATPDVMRSS